MKRQEFLKGVFATTALCYLPKSMLFAKNNTLTNVKKVHFIGLGGAGGNIINYIYSKGIKANYTYIDDFNSNRPASISYVSFSKEFQSRFEEENLPSLNENNELIPLSFIKEDETVILLAGLGGYTGTILSVYLFKKLQAKSGDVHLFATTPFMYENNSSRPKYTEYALKELRQDNNIFLISNEKQKKEYGHLPFNKAFEKINEMFLKKAMEIIG